jgi:hypothetical protein
MEFVVCNDPLQYETLARFRRPVPVTIPLVTAALLTAFLGVAHSYLGERYILMRLFRRGNLPDLFRNTEFTKRTLRLAWHIMTVLAFGFAMLLAVLASPGGGGIRTMIGIIAATFAFCGLLSLVISRARHLSWIVFFAIAGLTWIARP